MDQPDDRRLSFDAVPDVYDEIRPSYPAPLFDALFEMLPPQPTIVEVGPGTGQATKDLIVRGASVHAIEIGPALASRLRANLRSDRLRVVVGAFEEADIPPSSVDAVFSATAYHWISPGARVDRPANVLRPRGVLAIVDLIQVTSPEDRGFFEAVQPIYERYGHGRTGPLAPTRTAVDPPMRETLERDDRFDRLAVRHWNWDQTYDAAQYTKLLLSYSGTQAMAPSDRQGLLDDVESLVNRHFGGQVTRPLVATLTTAHLTATSTL